MDLIKIFFLGVVVWTSHALWAKEDWCAVEIDGFLMKRLACVDHRQLLIKDSHYAVEDQKEGSNVEPDARISSKDLIRAMPSNFGFSAALRLSFHHQSAFEVRYMQLRESEGKESLFLPRQLFADKPYSSSATPQNSQDYQRASFSEVQYASRFLGGEANYWGYPYPPFADLYALGWMIGFSLFKIDERMEITCAKEHGQEKVHVTTSSSSLRTNSYLFTPQIGCVVYLHPLPYLSIRLMAKVGVGYHRGCREGEVRDNNNEDCEDPYSVSGSGFCGHAQFYPQMIIHPSVHFSWLIGYQLFYFDHVTLADQQQMFKKDGLDQKGRLLNHGVMTGIQFFF